MAKIASFIDKLTVLTGTDTAAVKAWIEANKELEIPDEIVKGINDNIFTMDSAKNSPVIKDHFLATALNGVDTELERYMKEIGFDDATMATIKGEGKTAKKAIKIANTIKELTEAKVGAKGGDAKVLTEKIEALEKQVAAVNKELLSEKETAQSKLAEKESEMNNHLMNYKIDEKLSGFKYANDKIPISANTITAKTLIELETKKLGYKTEFDKENGKVKLLTSSNTEVFKDHKPYSYEEFISSVLADNHLLKVAEPQTQQPPKQIITPANGKDQPRNTSKFEQALQESKKDFAVATT